MRVKSKNKEDSHPHILLFFRILHTSFYEEEILKLFIFFGGNKNEKEYEMDNNSIVNYHHYDGTACYRKRKNKGEI